MVVEDDALSKEKEIDKLIALISLSFKKIYKPTNNNLRTSSNTRRENQDNNPRINIGTSYDNQMDVYVVGAMENVVNDTYPDEQDNTNIPTDSLDISNNGGEATQDEDEDLARERDLLASLIEKLKCEIDESKYPGSPLPQHHPAAAGLTSTTGTTTPPPTPAAASPQPSHHSTDSPPLPRWG
nr:hypothetical protein [Tanacetum cinerariifolium]